MTALRQQDQHLQRELEDATLGALGAFLQSEAANGMLRTAGVDYQMFLVRDQQGSNPEIFGPASVKAKTYSSDQLYGAARSPIPHFRSFLSGLQHEADSIQNCVEYDYQYFYKVILFWAEIKKLSLFLGASREVDEIIFVLTNVRFLFLGKDTPMAAIRAVGQAMKLATTANRITFTVADQVAEVLEAAGLDLLAIDSLRTPDA